jgi:hypothetical protein
MFIVYYKDDNNNGKIIRPTPFVSIGYNINRNKEQSFSGQYSITLNGILLATGGSPINNSNPNSVLNIGANYEDSDANIRGDYTRPEKQIIDFSDRAYSIFMKQQALRALFAHDGQKMEYSPITNDDTIMYFYPEVESINFEEGKYTDFCRYTINLIAPVIFDTNDNILDLGFGNYVNEENNDYHIDDYSDNWSIEVDETFARTKNTIQTSDTGPPLNNTADVIPRIYRVTRNVSATGRTFYFNGQRQEAWEQAKKYVKYNILNETINSPPSSQIENFPSYLSHNTFGSGLLDITNFNAYNAIRTENIDKSSGSYSMSDTWILSDTNAVENFNISLSSSFQSPDMSIEINGNIKGLSQSLPNESITENKTKFQNALAKFNSIFGDRGVESTIFKRAKNTTDIPLNPIPVSFSSTKNESNGEISYNITYNNRPSNLIPGVSQERITISDTYPGDVYAIIPVINRFNGPIFQYIGGRTEYKRDLTIEFIVDRSELGFNKMTKKASYIYRKPSISKKQIIQNIINQYSPNNEPNIRKYFLNPVSESWNPKTGSYSTQISWIYEVNQ